MESLIKELKNAREARKMSLSDISDATLINIRFLEALERGDFSFLPQTYVRAFLREYAQSGGLSPDDILRAYDAALQSTAAAPVQAETEQPPPPVILPPAPVVPPAPQPVRPEQARINPTIARIAVVTLVVLAVVIAVWNMLKPDGSSAIPETPFHSIKEERERNVAADSARIARPDAQVRAARRDTLTLVAVATDSAWIQLAIDNNAPRNYVLKPKGKATWRAAKRFTLTLGNAGAVEFMLNRKSLGRLGKAGMVVRNVELSHATLDQQ